MITKLGLIFFMVVSLEAFAADPSWELTQSREEVHLELQLMISRGSDTDISYLVRRIESNDQDVFVALSKEDSEDDAMTRLRVRTLIKLLFETFEESSSLRAIRLALMSTRHPDAIAPLLADLGVQIFGFGDFVGPGENSDPFLSGLIINLALSFPRSDVVQVFLEKGLIHSRDDIATASAEGLGHMGRLTAEHIARVLKMRSHSSLPLSLSMLKRFSLGKSSTLELHQPVCSHAFLESRRNQ